MHDRELGRCASKSFFIALLCIGFVADVKVVAYACIIWAGWVLAVAASMFNKHFIPTLIDQSKKCRGSRRPLRSWCNSLDRAASIVAVCIFYYHGATITAVVYFLHAFLESVINVKLSKYRLQL